MYCWFEEETYFHNSVNKVALTLMDLYTQYEPLPLKKYILVRMCTSPASSQQTFLNDSPSLEMFLS